MDFDLNKELIENCFGTDHINGGGRELRFNCPFCPDRRGKEDTDYKMYVNYGNLKYHCFKCDAAGVLKVGENLEDAFVDSNSSAIGKVVEYVEGLEKKEEINKDNEYFMIPKMRPVEGMSYEYLKSRGIDMDLIDFYDMRLGGFQDRKMYGRVIVPNRVIKGRFTDMYVARAYDGNPHRYNNPDASHRKALLFNYHRTLEMESIDICEGVFSAIAAGKQALASYGKYVAPEQRRLLVRHPCKAIYVALDPDAREQAEKLCFNLKEECNKKIYLVELPVTEADGHGLDPSDLGHERYLEFRASAREYQSKTIFDLMNLFKE